MFTKQSLFFKKHARRVLICKHALPIFAFLLAGLIIVWPLLTPDKERFDLPLQKSTAQTPSVDMENVRFHAQDNKNQTVTVTAKSVKEIQPEGQVARLENPVGIYTMADGDILTNKTAVKPSLKSSPIRFASFSFKMLFLRAKSFKTLVSPVFNPTSCVPPSLVGMLFT